MKARMPKVERHVSKKEIRILCDMIMMTAMIVLIEEFQYSKNKNFRQRKLHNEAEARLNQAILDYDTRMEYSSIRKEVKKHG